MMAAGMKRPLGGPDNKNLKHLIEMSQEPVVGCNQVIEYIADIPGLDPKYTCTMCDVTAPSPSHMISHLTGTKHRNAYIDRFEGRNFGDVPSRTPDGTRQICALIEGRMGRMTHMIRTVTGDQSYPGDLTRVKRIKHDGDSAGDNTNMSSLGMGMSSPSMNQHNMTESTTPSDTGLAVSDGPLGELLKQLSKCVVKNESDASMALYVSRALLGSLLDYRTKNHPDQAALLKDMLKTMGGMLRTMALADTGAAPAGQTGGPIINTSQQLPGTMMTQMGSLMNQQNPSNNPLVNSMGTDQQQQQQNSMMNNQQELMMNQQNQMMNQQNPMMNQQNPMMNQQNPMMNQQNPMMNQQNPMMNQHNPMMNQQNPMMNQQNPMGQINQGMNQPNQGMNQLGMMNQPNHMMNNQPNPLMNNQRNPMMNQMMDQQNPMMNQPNPMMNQGMMNQQNQMGMNHQNAMMNQTPRPLMNPRPLMGPMARPRMNAQFRGAMNPNQRPMGNNNNGAAGGMMNMAMMSQQNSMMGSQGEGLLGQNPMMEGNAAGQLLAAGNDDSMNMGSKELLQAAQSLLGNLLNTGGGGPPRPMMGRAPRPGMRPGGMRGRMPLGARMRARMPGPRGMRPGMRPGGPRPRLNRPVGGQNGDH